MASSPEQEIPQEIVEAVGIEYLLRMPVGSSIEKEPLRAALAAVLPDLQRPLLEEIERLKNSVIVNRQAFEVAEGGRKIWMERAEKAEAERDARPDLTRENILTLMKLVPSAATIPEREAYAKLERSLHAHKP